MIRNEARTASGRTRMRPKKRKWVRSDHTRTRARARDSPEGTSCLRAGHTTAPWFGDLPCIAIPADNRGCMQVAAPRIDPPRKRVNQPAADHHQHSLALPYFLD